MQTRVGSPAYEHVQGWAVVITPLHARPSNALRLLDLHCRQIDPAIFGAPEVAQNALKHQVISQLFGY